MLLNKRKIIILKLLYALYLLVPITLWTNQSLFDSYSIGLLLGLLSLAFVAIMPLLSSRMPILEQGVGQDRLLIWHSWNAKMALISVALHPVFLFGTYIQRQLSIFDIAEFYHSFAYWLGYLLLILLIIVTVTSIFTKRLKIDYEIWKKIHLLTYIIVIGGFVHSFLISSHIQPGSLFMYWWRALLVIAVVGIIHRRALLPRKRIIYEVIKTEKEANNIISLYTKSTGKKLSHAPGQFAYTRFYSPKLSPEEHHFTISSAPHDPYLRFTIKALGDFTSTLAQVKPRDRISIEGPYGAFSNQGMKGPFLFIAGGIGITPIMSMLLAMLNNKKRQDSILIYAANSVEEMAFKKDISKLNKEEWFGAQLLDVRIQNGHLQDALITLKEVPQVFLVGPEPMMKDVEKMLVKLKVPKTNIFTEKFALK